jgi:hypothetical protein
VLAAALAAWMGERALPPLEDPEEQTTVTRRVPSWKNANSPEDAATPLLRALLGLVGRSHRTRVQRGLPAVNWRSSSALPSAEPSSTTTTSVSPRKAGVWAAGRGRPGSARRCAACGPGRPRCCGGDDDGKALHDTPASAGPPCT